MTRKTIGRVLAMLAVTLTLALPAAGPVLAQDVTDDGTVIIQANVDVLVPEGEHRDVVLLFTADASILGEVETLVVFDGSATLTGARVDTLVVVGGAVDVGAGSVVDEVRTIDSTYHVAPDASVGSQTSIEPALVAATLAPVAIAAWLGFALAYVLAGLLVAAIAGAQLRRAGTALTREPGAVTLGALGVLIGAPLLIAALAVTLVGIPTALLVAIVVLPIVWFVGSLTVAVRIGDWLLLRTRGRIEADHPLVAAFLGTLVVGILSIIPMVGFLVALAGAGAVVVIAWRAAFGGGTPSAAPVLGAGPAPA